MVELTKQLEGTFIRAILIYFYKQNLLTEAEFLRIKEDLESGNKYVAIITLKSDVYV